MKNFLLRFTFLIIVIYVTGCNDCKKCEDKDCKVTKGWGDLLLDSSQTIYRKNELIVIYKDTPTDAKRRTLKERYKGKGIDTSKIVVTTCSDCDGYVELWNGEGIQTVINGPGGAGGNTRGASDDTLAHYSLNFISRLPENKFERPDSSIKRQIRKDTIRVAVLDTGFDTLDFPETSAWYLWKSGPEYADAKNQNNCYPNAHYGWNFVNRTSNVFDDNGGKHGTLLTQYILNEMSANRRNIIQVMSLKTHDKNGIGNLFDIICALHYAVKNKANLINASWGFYYFDVIPHPYLNELITEILPSQGILFVAAAGNQGDDTDADAIKANCPPSMLRNLEYHKFYPANLSNANNSVLTVTTTDAKKVSTQQNYSGNYVDLAVQADTVTDDMYFHWPYRAPKKLVNGSSFATAIVSGVIAANAPKSVFQPGVTKTKVFESLSGIIGEDNTSLLKYSDSLKYNNLVRNGRYIKHGNAYLSNDVQRPTQRTALQ